jgi:uncharacterized protein YdeI (YjbR/CyaY-like superfamily)
MSFPNPLVDQFLVEGCMRCSLGATPACKALIWTDILEFLRQLILETELQEERKWGVPTYTLHAKNVVMLGVFKDSCVLSFIKGQLLPDPKGLLALPGPNSREGRILRFTQLNQASTLENEIRHFLQEAIQVERSGKKAAASSSRQLLPEELLQKFAEHPGLETAFFALTPGRQRGYLIHFSGAKQSPTRLSRIEKCIPKIFSGKGMMD